MSYIKQALDEMCIELNSKSSTYYNSKGMTA